MKYVLQLCDSLSGMLLQDWAGPYQLDDSKKRHASKRRTSKVMLQGPYQQRLKSSNSLAST